MELWITLVASLIALIVLAWLVKVIKTTVATALRIAALVWLAQIFFGIGPATLWQRLGQMANQLAGHWLRQVGLPSP